MACADHAADGIAKIDTVKNIKTTSSRRWKLVVKKAEIFLLIGCKYTLEIFKSFFRFKWFISNLLPMLGDYITLFTYYKSWIIFLRYTYH